MKEIVTMFPKLYTDVGNPQTLKLVIAARLSNKDLQVIFTEDEGKKERKTFYVTKKSNICKIKT